MFGEQVQTLPIAPPTDAIRSETEQVVTRLIEISRASREARQLLLDWLRSEFEVQDAGRRLENLAEMDQAAFVEEVRKRRPRSASRLTPATLKALQVGYNELIAPIQQRQSAATALERRLNELVNAAYGLTDEEIALLWETAPPRMPPGAL